MVNWHYQIMKFSVIAQMVSTECYPQDYVNGYFQVDGWDFAQPRRLPQCGYRFDDFVNYHFIYYKFKNFTYYILSLILSIFSLNICSKNSAVWVLIEVAGYAGRLHSTYSTIGMFTYTSSTYQLKFLINVNTTY